MTREEEVDEIESRLLSMLDLLDPQSVEGDYVANRHEDIKRITELARVDTQTARVAKILNGTPLIREDAPPAGWEETSLGGSDGVSTSTLSMLTAYLGHTDIAVFAYDGNEDDPWGGRSPDDTSDCSYACVSLQMGVRWKRRNETSQ